MFGSKKNGDALTPKQLERVGADLRRVGEAGRIEVDGVDLSYWRAGHGERNIVFVHGNSGAKEVFYNQFEAFHDAGYTLLAVDLPGHGSSADAAAPEAQYTIPGYALIIKQVMDALDVKEPVLVGWSLGGHIVLEMAGRGFSPKALLTVGTPPAGPGGAAMQSAFLPKAFESATVRGEASREEMEMFAKDAYGTLDPVPPFLVEAAVRTDGRARAVMGEHWMSGLGGCDQLVVAAGWTRPICVVHGLKDPFVSLDYIKQATWRNLWRNRVIEMAHCGHSPFLEDPAGFNATLNAFLADVF